MKTTIVTTTIHVPRTFDSLVDNLAAHGHSGVDFIVVGDRKTPAETGSYLAELGGRGYPAAYWDVERQKEWLRRFPALDAAIPWNCIQRRNVGYLLAYEAGADIVISIDDDNFVTGDDFAGGHAITGQVRTLPAVCSSTGWFNSCDLLANENGRHIYHRGFPYSQRWQNERVTYQQTQGRVVVNVGLWTGVPDVDAVTHLEGPCEVTGFRDRAPDCVALGPNTWSPFNSQNTAYLRDVLPLMFLQVMGDEISGVRVGRYDDIWMSYFAQKVISRVGGLIGIGRPLMRQNRNPHDFFVDLSQELPGMVLTNKLIVTIRDLELRCSGYVDCFVEFTDLWWDAVSRSAEYSSSEKAYVAKMAGRMHAWIETCRQLG